MIKWFKRLFRRYKPGYEYWVNLSDIYVPYYYKVTKVGEKKWLHKLNYWRETGEFESKILIDKNFRLVDGYSSVKIAYLNDVNVVPVYFVDKK